MAATSTTKTATTPSTTPAMKEGGKFSPSMHNLVPALIAAAVGGFVVYKYWHKGNIKYAAGIGAALGAVAYVGVSMMGHKATMPPAAPAAAAKDAAPAK